MSRKHQILTEPEQALIEALEPGLGEHYGRPVRVRALEWKRHSGFSTHPLFHLQVRLAGGEVLPVVFKRLEPRPDKDIHREVVVYRTLLRGRRFGAPVLYASLLDESRARYWLFLEEVQGWRLDWCKTEVWERAFRWLAAMHARYYGGEDELRAMNCLREHGAAFYWRRAREAREKLARYGEPHWLTRFDALMERFDETVAHLEEQPCTLVHGSPSCNHFIVEKGGALRLVDWEGAAIGLPAWDLERLLEGWGERKPRLIASYLAEFAKHAEAPSAAALERDVLHLTVLRAHRYLYWWGRACRDPAFIEGLLTSIERAYRRLEALEVARRG